MKLTIINYTYFSNNNGAKYNGSNIQSCAFNIGLGLLFCVYKIIQFLKIVKCIIILKYDV